MLYVIRHAETPHNAEGRIRGMDNPGLTPKGRVEAAGIGKQLAGKVDRVVTDGMKRTNETAKIAFPNHTPEIDPRLTTLNVGKYSGMKTSPKVEKEFNSQYVAHPNKKIPGGESVNDWLPKVKSAFDEYRAQSKNQNIALVTHGRPQSAMVNGFKPEAAKEGNAKPLASVVKIGPKAETPNSNPTAPEMNLARLARA